MYQAQFCTFSSQYCDVCTSDYLKIQGQLHIKISGHLKLLKKDLISSLCAEENMQGCHGTGRIGKHTKNLPKRIKNMIIHRKFTSNTRKFLKLKKLNYAPGL